MRKSPQSSSRLASRSSWVKESLKRDVAGDDPLARWILFSSSAAIASSRIRLVSSPRHRSTARTVIQPSGGSAQ